MLHRTIKETVSEALALFGRHVTKTKVSNRQVATAVRDCPRVSLAEHCVDGCVRSGNVLAILRDVRGADKGQYTFFRPSSGDVEATLLKFVAHRRNAVADVDLAVAHEI